MRVAWSDYGRDTAFKKIFSMRLSELMKERALNDDFMSQLLGLRHRSSVSDLLSMRNAPSVYVLFSISRIFGVSTDWLGGLTQERSNEELLEDLEKDWLPLLKICLTKPEGSECLSYIPEALGDENILRNYLVWEKREILGCDLRMDIIFALHIVKFLSMEAYDEGIDLKRVRLRDYVGRLLEGTKTKRAKGECCRQACSKIRHYIHY